MHKSACKHKKVREHQFTVHQFITDLSRNKGLDIEVLAIRESKCDLIGCIFLRTMLPFSRNSFI